VLIHGHRSGCIVKRTFRRSFLPQHSCLEWRNVEHQREPSVIINFNSNAIDCRQRLTHCEGLSGRRARFRSEAGLGGLSGTMKSKDKCGLVVWPRPSMWLWLTRGWLLVGVQRTRIGMPSIPGGYICELCHLRLARCVESAVRVHAETLAGINRVATTWVPTTGRLLGHAG